VEINVDEIKNYYFLVRNKERRDAFYMTAENNDTEILEKKLVWAKDTQTESKYVKGSIVVYLLTPCSRVLLEKLTSKLRS
jgi:hypothetical protein